jgi:hypothetical protein
MGRNQGLQSVCACELVRALAVDERESFLDLVPPPALRVLIGKQDEPGGSILASRRACWSSISASNRYLRLVGNQLAGHPTEADRLLAELGSH